MQGSLLWGYFLIHTFVAYPSKHRDKTASITPIPFSPYLLTWKPREYNVADCLNHLVWCKWAHLYAVSHPCITSSNPPALMVATAGWLKCIQTNRDFLRQHGIYLPIYLIYWPNDNQPLFFWIKIDDVVESKLENILLTMTEVSNILSNFICLLGNFVNLTFCKEKLTWFFLYPCRIKFY